MYLIPALSVLLALVLAAAARNVRADMERLQSWMRESAEAEAKGA